MIDLGGGSCELRSRRWKIILRAFFGLVINARTQNIPSPDTEGDTFVREDGSLALCGKSCSTNRQLAESQSFGSLSATNFTRGEMIHDGSHTSC